MGYLRNSVKIVRCLRRVNPLQWRHLIYARWQRASLQQQQTGISTLARARWINSASIFSAGGPLWFITAVLLVSGEWWMSVRTHTRAKRSRHNRTLHRHNFSVIFPPPNSERSKVSRRAWFNCVHVCQISPSVCDLHLLLYAGKVNSRCPLSLPGMISWGNTRR